MEYLDTIDELLTKLDNNGQEEEYYLYFFRILS